MRKLYLLRHAKSSWTRPLPEDHDRPLARRGRIASRRVADYLSHRHPPPDLVLASTAVRTLETAHRVGAGWNPPPPVMELPSLYLAPSGDMLKCIHAVNGAPVLMLVGHNPGMADLATLLVGDDPAFGGKFPTGGLAIFNFSVDDWAQADTGTGRLEIFVTPRQLAGRD